MWQSWLGICCEVQDIIAIGSGPSDGHPTLLSSYRSELGRILASLYVIYKICDHYNIQEGKATLYCDNKGAIQKYHSILSSDYNLLGLIRHLVCIIPITILGGLVKGHYSGKEKTFQA